MAARAHSSRNYRRRPFRLSVACAVVAVVVVAAAGATYAVGHKSGRPSAAHTSNKPSAPTTVPGPPTPLSVLSVSPASGSTGVDPASPIHVTFSAPVALGAVKPTLTPAMPGTWSVSGATMTFSPAGGFVPYTSVNVSVPAGITGAAGSNTIPLATAASTAFTVAAGSFTRLQELLAELGYMPVTFTANSATPGELPINTESSTVGAVSTSTVGGSFSWRFGGTPASLMAQWSQGANNVITRGAVMAFESDHGLAYDGTAGAQVWTDLLGAVANRQVDPRAYGYVMVSQGRPETLQVWTNGQITATTLVNTGVRGAATATGTYPVFERFASTTMRGTNPDGSKYADPGVPWVAYFNGGDAVHGFPRGSYGYPQSDGCVELPIGNAKVVWGMDPIGTLVTVA